MDIKTLKEGFKQYLIDNYDVYGIDVEKSSASIFLNADIFKAYLQDTYNPDESLFSKNLSEILEMEIVNGELVDVEELEEEKQEEIKNDENIENPENEDLIPDENIDENIDTNFPQQDPQIPQDPQETPIIPDEDTPIIEDDAQLPSDAPNEEEVTEENSSDDDFIVGLLNELLLDETFKASLDSDNDSEITNEELNAYLNSIKNLDGDDETLSFNDILNSINQIATKENQEDEAVDKNDETQIEEEQEEIKEEEQEEEKKETFTLADFKKFINALIKADDTKADIKDEDEEEVEETEESSPSSGGNSGGSIGGNSGGTISTNPTTSTTNTTDDPAKKLQDELTSKYSAMTLDQLQQEKTTQQNELSTQQEDVVKFANGSHPDLQDKKTAMENSQKEFKQTMEQVDADTAKKLDEILTQQRENNAQIAATDAEIANADTNIAQQNTIITNSNARIEALNASKSALSQVASSTATDEKSKAAAQAATQKIAQIDSEIKAENDKITAANEQIKALEAKKQELTTKKTELEQKKTQIDASYQEISAQAQKIIDENPTVAAALEKFAQAQNEYLTQQVQLKQTAQDKLTTAKTAVSVIDSQIAAKKLEEDKMTYAASQEQVAYDKETGDALVKSGLSLWSGKSANGLCLKGVSDSFHATLKDKDGNPVSIPFGSAYLAYYAFTNDQEGFKNATNQEMTEKQKKSAEYLSENFEQVEVTEDQLKTLPAGAVVIWDKTSKKPHGHISIATGDGREISDEVRSQDGKARHDNAPFHVFVPVNRTTLSAQNTGLEAQNLSNTTQNLEDIPKGTKPDMSKDEFIDSIEDKQTKEFYQKLFEMYDYDTFFNRSDVPQYFQTMYTEPFAQGTIRSAGCGITSLAMISSYLLGEEITPDELTNNYRGDNPASAMEKGFKNLNLDVQRYEGQAARDNLDAALEKGPIIARVGPSSKFTDNGHFIVITRKTADGKYIVNDPNLENYYNKTMVDGFTNGFELKDITQGLRGIYSLSKKSGVSL